MFNFMFFMMIISFVSGVSYKNKIKFKELNEVPKGMENGTDESVPGVKLFVKWEKWSCCSACCCPKVVCGQFATTDCDSVKSTKHRRGEFMLNRQDQTGDVELEKLFKKDRDVPLSEAIENSNLTDLLKNSRKNLNEKLNVPVETLEVFQIEDCQDDPQKKDCWKLTKCLYNTSEMLPEIEAVMIEERDVCENATIIVLREAYNILSLESDKLYRLQIDKSIGDGNIISANYTYQGQSVEKLKHVKDCVHQPKRIFQHPNGEDLIVRLSGEQLSKNPEIIAVISYQNPAQIEIAIDIVLQTTKKKEKSPVEDEWFSIVFISSLALATLFLLGLSLFFLW